MTTPTDYAGNTADAPAARDTPPDCAGIVAPQLRRPLHKTGPWVSPPGHSPPPGQFQTDGGIITNARRLAPSIFSKRTSDDDRAAAVDALRNALSMLLSRAHRILESQHRPPTDAEQTMLNRAADMDSKIECCRVLLENSPDYRAAVKRAVDNAVAAVAELDAYRGTAPAG